MPIFNFQLQPIGDIEPWQGASGPRLSWFGLSMGWYWLSLAGQEVLRVQQVAGSGALPYVDYQVVRLWEDLLEMLPSALEPVPEDVATCLRDITRWEASVRRASQEGPDAAWDSVGWWHARRLSMFHLVQAPAVHLWRVGSAVHVAWASDPEDRDLWAPCRGTCTLGVETFLEEVRAFDRAFLEAMGERVRVLVGAGGIDGVSIDLEHLQREQEERSTWLEAALRLGGSRHPRPTDWASVREHLARAVRGGA